MNTDEHGLKPERFSGQSKRSAAFMPLQLPKALWFTNAKNVLTLKRRERRAPPRDFALAMTGFVMQSDWHGN
jgi:hypothetical protein